MAGIVIRGRDRHHALARRLLTEDQSDFRPVHSRRPRSPYSGPGRQSPIRADQLAAAWPHHFRYGAGREADFKLALALLRRRRPGLRRSLHVSDHVMHPARGYRALGHLDPLVLCEPGRDGEVFILIVPDAGT